MDIVDGDCQCGGLQTRTTACRARNLAHVRFELLAHVIALGIDMATFDPRNHAFIGRAELANFTETVLVLDLHGTNLSVQDKLLLFG